MEAEIQQDWTGSSAQRKRHPSGCFYPHAKPTPRPAEYRVPEGTDCLVKRTGDKAWKRYRTTKDCDFDSVYRTTDQSLIFFRVGYLLCVKKAQVVTVGYSQ